MTTPINGVRKLDIFRTMSPVGRVLIVQRVDAIGVEFRGNPIERRRDRCGFSDGEARGRPAAERVTLMRAVS